MSFTLQSNINQLTIQMRRKAEKLVKDTAFNIQSRMRDSMAEPKSGTRRGRHVASAPGESPAVDTSFLTNSIQFESAGLQAVVGTNADYAEVLEFGGVHIAPRPFFDPAFENEKPVFERALRELVK